MKRKTGANYRLFSFSRRQIVEFITGLLVSPATAQGCWETGAYCLHYTPGLVWLPTISLLDSISLDIIIYLLKLKVTQTKAITQI